MALIELEEKYLELMLSWRNAESVRKNMYSSRVITFEEHRKWFEINKNKENSKWFVYIDEDKNPIGVIYITEINNKTKNAFWGFYLSEKSKKGVGTSMCKEALSHAFGEMGLHKINSEILEFNNISLRLHEKLGFKKEGVFRDFHFLDGEYINVYRMGILKTEWEIIKYNF